MRNREKSEVFEGNQLNGRLPASRKNASFSVFGFDRLNNADYLGFDDYTLEKHLLFLGGIGTGKSNALYHFVKGIKETLTEDDILIIFDTKGDFLFNTHGNFSRDFYSPGDIIISNDEHARGKRGTDYWNIFHEIETGDHSEESINEIAKTLFFERIKGSNSPFFPNAAKDIFAGVLTHFYREAERASNQELRAFFDECSAESLSDVLSLHPDLKAITNYIRTDNPRQTQGVVSEILQLVRDILIGNFKKAGLLSMRQLVRAKGGRTVFIEYDLGTGKVLEPIYSLLFDLAIKEALSRKKSAGNVWIIADEFKLLPNLQHIDNAINFGRSLGVKMMIGVQNVEQLFEIYGEHRARSILSGLSTTITFRLNDEVSRGYIKGLFGQNRKKQRMEQINKNLPPQETIISAHVVEDWDISNLRLGEAIIGLPGQEPFFFKFFPFEPA